MTSGVAPVAACVIQFAPEAFESLPLASGFSAAATTTEGESTVATAGAAASAAFSTDCSRDVSPALQCSTKLLQSIAELEREADEVLGLATELPRP